MFVGGWIGLVCCQPLTTKMQDTKSCSEWAQLPHGFPQLLTAASLYEGSHHLGILIFPSVTHTLPFEGTLALYGVRSTQEALLHLRSAVDAAFLFTPARKMTKAVGHLRICFKHPIKTCSARPSPISSLWLTGGLASGMIVPKAANAQAWINATDAACPVLPSGE
jgi:hypothetical protein